jgi:hypothetical protein
VEEGSFPEVAHQVVEECFLAYGQAFLQKKWLSFKLANNIIKKIPLLGSIVYLEVALEAFSFPSSCRVEAVVTTASVLEVVPGVAFGRLGAEESLAAS